MKRIKFKVAYHDFIDDEDIFPEINGYLIDIEGIKVVLHHTYHLYESRLIKCKIVWNASEYYSGRSIARYGSSRKDILKIATDEILNVIKKRGITRVMKIINKAPKINN